MKTVKTFATSANIGPGFDTLGMCFDIYNEYAYEMSNHYILEGFDENYNIPEKNLIIKSYEYVLNKYNHNIIYLKLKQLEKNIPSTRGLGSSASCIVCGVLIANDVLNNILVKDEIFQLASEIEGHPDNVAPLIYGGFTCSYFDNEFYQIKLSINKDYKFYVCIPPFKLSTTLARNVLPKQVDLKTAVSNVSHSIAMVKALENGNMKLLQSANNDLLHEPFRYPLIQDANVIIDYAKINNAVCMISGAGPTLLLISKDDLNLDINLSGWIFKKVNINNQGAYVYEK